MAAQVLVLLALLAASALGDPGSAGRRPQHQLHQHPGRLCSLGTCQTHRLPQIIYWLRSASTKEPSGKAGRDREPQDPHSYGRRRRRETRALLRAQDPGPQYGVQRRAQLAG
ncbi:putative adrenomedullin-5-like protein [Tupaia chinensis]|uniref:Adrenomedullin 5 n=1 Tax=Tupaia chinensis TaxID=246437 RepID=L9JA29_TUPCH|nr:putative adrenomedullin-5-like protein [Tupaia chinensis]ELW47129.1 Adrenomedullin 5 [Tupaia chinensis]